MDDRLDIEPMLQQWLDRQIGEVVAVRALEGGITARMVQLRRVDGTGDVVLRRWAGTDSDDARRVGTEAAVLTALADTDLPVPRLLAADPDGSRSGAPTTVTTFLDGAVDLDPRDLRSWIRELATMLVDIHSLAQWSDPTLQPCDVWSRDDQSWLDSGLYAAAHQLAARSPDPAARVLAHGDYQQFNVLWQQGRLSGVVDWPSAGLADRGLDVGHCRLNLAVLYSADAAMQFLDDYEQLAGVVVDPAPDVQQLLTFGPQWPQFIPIQVAGRRTVDPAGMPERVRETVIRTLRRAG